LYDGLSKGMYTFILCNIMIIPLLVIFYGFSNQLMDKQRKIRPNQGIWRTVQLSVVWLIPTLLFASSAAIFSRIILFGPDYALANLATLLLAGILVGMAFGLYYWQLRGGMAFIQHFTLRVLLWHTKLIPWNYVSFLDNTASHALLYKVGGGYVFIHRQLLEYFASLYTSESAYQQMTQSRSPSLSSD